MMMLTQLAIKL